MRIPPQIAVRGIERTPAMEAAILGNVEWLDRFYDRITACRVLVEQAHRHQRAGNLFHVRIDLTVPGREIVVRRDPPADHAHEDVEVAVGDAFDAARRRLDDYVRERRGETKVHPLPPRARVARVFPEEGYGFLQTLDGREVYFHRNAVHGAAIEALEPGVEVHFVEEEGHDGPQAATVHVPRRRRRAAAPQGR